MDRTVTPGERRGPSTLLLFPVLDFGGIESRAVIQATVMADRGADVRVVCFAADGRAARRIRDAGVAVDVLGTAPSVRNPRALWQLWRYLRVHPVEVLHARTGAMTVHGLIAGWLAGVPIRIAEEVGVPERGRIGRMLFPHLYRLATCVVGVSDAVTSYLVERDGVPPSKVRRVYNAVEARFFTSPPSAGEAPGFHILAAGRLVPVKGHDHLLEALAPLLREDPAVDLRIAGDGPQREALEERARRLGIEHQTDFLGYRDDLPHLLAEADLFVLPSRMEGFGLAVAEAMAARTPVVATRVGGIPEVVPPWAHVWLVEPGEPSALADAVTRMRALPRAERDALGDRLHDHAVERFGPDRYVAELEALYTELLASARSR